MIVPKEWLEALEIVKTVFPNSMLAGGCLRDYAHGVEVKDIDIVVYNPLPYITDSVIIDTVQVAIDRAFDKVEPKEPIDRLYECAESEISGNGVEGISDIAKVVYKGLDVDVIVRVDAERIYDVIDNFPDNLSRIAHDGKRYYSASSYEQGHLNKELIIDWSKNNPRNEALMCQRIVRLMRKYPTYKLVEVNRL